ncbi:MAG: NCS1 family nucleobase:cation symporter-1 [Cyanobacteria bacterium SZAS LIN-2]|nr:NCS1 family nucleobase:cation symporter-1 [Cyanobacteria bacterium SZAS LIN-2]
MSDEVKSEGGLLIHADGRVELADTAEISKSPMYNHDLAPVAVSARNWSTYNYIALWFAMSACIPTYMMSSGLIASGMNAMQAIITILLGNTVVLVPILLNSHPGTKYGIPFPVFARAAYGTIGSNLPALMRALVACGWFGIQAWIGGQAFDTMFKAINPAWHTALGGPVGGYMVSEWVSFALFWGLNIFIVYRGMDLLKKVEGFAAPFVLFMTAALFIWAINQAHGTGDLLHAADKFATFGEFLKVFVPSLTAMIGFWATLSLNMPDFTRFGHSQKEQTIGQVIALPTAMAVFSTMGVVITSCAVIIYPTAKMSELWDPVKLIGRFTDPTVVVIAMFTVALATLSVNVAANVVSPANDFANAFPRYISFKTGGLITGIVGLLMQPWRLIADPSGYIFVWLQGYSGGLGAIAGVLIADYWLIRRTKLNLADLYLLEGEYKYGGGWNFRAVVATAVGCLCAWVGAFVPALKTFYDYGWFVGFGVALVVYYALQKGARQHSPK